MRLWKQVRMHLNSLRYQKVTFTASVLPDYVLHQRLYSKTCVKRSLSKRPKIGFQDHLALNAGQQHCRLLQVEHSAILSTCIKLPFAIKIFVCLLLSGRFTQVYCVPL